MKLAKNTNGFTVVEVMIFMVVSGMVLTSAVGLFTGRQRQIQYEQGMRNLDFRVIETINNVVVGHFPSSNISCSNDSGLDYLDLSTGGGTQGTNDQCVFVGMGIELDSTDEDKIIVTPLVAANPALGMTFPLTNESAKITPVMDLRTEHRTSHGLPISGMIDESGSLVQSILFLSSLGAGQEFSPSLLASGTQSINLYTSNSPLIAGQRVEINEVLSGDSVYICTQHQTNDDIRGAINLGFNRSDLTTAINQDISGSHPCQAT